MHGVSFKKRAPRAIKEIRGFAVKAMVSFRLEDLGKFNISKEMVITPGFVLGNQGCSSRSSTQQKSMGIRYQGCAFQAEGEDIEEA